MIANTDLVAIRRAAAVGHFLPGFGYRIRHLGQTLVEVIQRRGPHEHLLAQNATHPIIDCCQVRNTLASALNGQDEHSNRLLSLLGHPQRLDGQPLRVDWALAAPGRLHQSGLIELTLAEDSKRWLFATIAPLEMVADIADGFADDSEQSIRIDGFFDPLLNISLVVAEDPGSGDVRRVVSEILDETMAQELLCDGAAETRP